jgi:hypothetical protein
MRSLSRLLPAVAVAIAGCATVPSVADRSYAAGEYPSAAAAYEEALRTDPRARGDAALCLRLGLSYAAPGTSAHDPARAIAVLNDVAARFPKTAEGAQASLLVPQLEFERTLAADLAAIAARAGALEAELARMREENRSLEAAAKATAEQLARARASLAEKETQLRRVRDELEQLKRIDLQRAP